MHAALPLLASDAALLSASAATMVLTGSVDENFGICAAFPVVGIAFLGLRGRYRPRLRLVVLDEVPRVAGALSLAAMVLIALALLVGDADAPGRVVAPVWALATAVLSASGAAIAVAQRRRRSRTVPTERALIIGAGLVGTHIARRLREQPEYGLEVCGFLDDDPPRDVHAAPWRPPILGAPDDLPRIAAQTGARHVLIAFSAQTDRTLLPVVHCSRALGLEVSIVPRLFDVVGEHSLVEHVGGLPLLRLKPLDPHGWRFAVKDVIDRVAAAIALLLLAPLLVGIALLIRLESPGPVFFRQVRVGRDGCRFELLKFRSMRPAREGPPSSSRRGTAPGGVEGEDRRTTLGRWLRRTSLDELPQLINVLRGEMSLVGPRPERPEFVELFDRDVERYGDRHRVKAGMTGWAQVHGLRGQTSLGDRVELDNFYIENWSLTLDLKILLLTFRALLSWRHER
jgi:exopolysaccharide biosynthesis polyprenyl glycosylphosphotransferase